MKHTQGKWSVRGRRNLLVVGSENQDPIIIASVAHDNFGNARLIANAPEMLSALKWIAESEVSILPNQNYKQAVNEWVAKAGKMARKAIDKAEGK
jgi:hypothetical protein